MDINFLEWVIKKYKLAKSLAYFCLDVKWSFAAKCHWNDKGIPDKFIGVLQDKITILALTGKIPMEENRSLKDLLEEYKGSKRKKNEIV